MKKDLRVHRIKQIMYLVVVMGPSFLLLSYVFVFDMLGKYIEFVLWQHLVWVVLSVVVCGVWIATDGLLGRFLVSNFLIGIFMFLLVQMGMHVLVFIAFCLPIYDLLGY